MRQGPPDDPITELAAGAAQMHELFMEWVRAGFTRAEALQLVITVMAASFQHHSPPGHG